jgi:Tol biopolymer transport system component
VRWSRDGAGILVNVTPQNDNTGGFGGLYLFDLGPEQYRVLLEREFQGQGSGIAELSPDGKTLYTMTRRERGGPSTLVAIHTATGERRDLYELPPSPNQQAGLALSPDGETLALQTWAEMGTPLSPGKAQLTLVDARSGAARPLTGPYSATTVFSNFAWLPDGQSVLLTMAERPHEWRLMRVPVSGGEPVFDGLESSTAVAGTSLPALVANILSLSVSPDGSRVAFGSYVRPKAELWVIGNVFSLLSR